MTSSDLYLCVLQSAVGIDCVQTERGAHGSLEHQDPSSTSEASAWHTCTRRCHMTFKAC